MDCLEGSDHMVRCRLGVHSGDRGEVGRKGAAQAGRQSRVCPLGWCGVCGEWASIHILAQFPSMSGLPLPTSLAWGVTLVSFSQGLPLESSQEEEPHAGYLLSRRS